MFLNEDTSSNLILICYLFKNTMEIRGTKAIVYLLKHLIFDQMIESPKEAANRISTGSKKR
jgi:hypothetical protein